MVTAQAQTSGCTNWSQGLHLNCPTCGTGMEDSVCPPVTALSLCITLEGFISKKRV